MNVKAGYGFGRAEVTLDVLNLFDAADPDISYFYTSRLNGEVPEGVADVHFHPALPRTLRLNAIWRF